MSTGDQHTGRVRSGGLHRPAATARAQRRTLGRGSSARRAPARAELDPKTLALVRLAALVAAGGSLPSYGAQADAAVGAGATAAEIVGVLVSIVDLVGMPCVVAAAPTLAMALGIDADEAFER